MMRTMSSWRMLRTNSKGSATCERMEFTVSWNLDVLRPPEFHAQWRSVPSVFFHFSQVGINALLASWTWSFYFYDTNLGFTTPVPHHQKRWLAFKTSVPGFSVPCVEKQSKSLRDTARKGMSPHRKTIYRSLFLDFILAASCSKESKILNMARAAVWCGLRVGVPFGWKSLLNSDGELEVT